MNKKETGSYYTPDYLAEFMSRRVFSKYKGKTISIFEPSVGNGKFVKAIKETQGVGRISIMGIDVEKEELKKVRKIWCKKGSTFRKCDFLDFKTDSKFSIAIGNPPYIKGNRLTSTQIKKCKKIHLDNGLSSKSIKNIWTSFLLKSTFLLKENGILALVLPLELLQVKFTEEIREFLKNSFERIEIFTFDDLVFESIGQDTLVLIAYKSSEEKGVYYSNIKDKSQLENQTYILKKNEALVHSNIKWTHHVLSSDELIFLHNLKEDLKPIEYYCDSKPGIVTAANSFFIISEEVEKKYGLEKYTVPIVQKGLFVNGGVVFDKKDYLQLVKSNLPSKFLKFEDNDAGKFSEKVLEYLEIGEREEIHARYKCQKRKNWFVVPNVANEPEAFFLKRSHRYPKIIKNSANVFVTDSAYKISMNNGYNISSLIYSFYNSLTLAFAELEGRYYGGGVLELVPSEFKKLAIPYFEITKSEFNLYRKSFERKRNIEDVLAQNDYRILNSTLKLSNRKIQKISKIRQKLILKRLRKNEV